MIVHRAPVPVVSNIRTQPTLQEETRRQSVDANVKRRASQVLLVCGLYRAWYEPADWCSGVWLLVACSAALAAFEVFHTLLHYAWLRRRGTPLLPPTVLKAISCCMVAALLLLVFVDAQSSIFRLNSLGGVLVTLVIAIASSNNWHMSHKTERASCGRLLLGGMDEACARTRPQIDWVLVARSLVAQYAIAFLFLRWASGKAVLSCVGRLVTRFFSFAADGSEHLFGYLTTGRNVGALLNYSDFEEPVVEYVHLQPVFAFQVFPVILLVGSMVNLLYYTRLMQAVVFRVGGIISLFVGSTICESACAGANVFIGMLSADYLLTACLMSVPSSLLCSKLFYPESQEPLPYTSLDMLACTEASMLEACVVGCRQAIRVLGNIVALSISFLGCIKTFESVLASLSDSVGLNDVTLEMAFGYLMTPLSLAMGVSSTDSFTFGRLVGVKVVSNEFVAYIMLLKNLKNLQRRTVMLATFALCGFGNVCAVGIALGALGALCPERLSTVADLGFRAMWAGCTASLLNACVVGERDHITAGRDSVDAIKPAAFTIRV
ncbi:hypothetical protein V5799_015109 [Amblyomma americanum]|uniref:Uncharacterized protein n=1 Tax=Amblyomma americanum TaxID=6943 RepID=A0AAQ4E136_AMBAM